MLKRSAALFLLTSAGPLWAQAPALSPATPAQIAAGVSACIAATQPERVNEAALVQAGWSKGTPKDAKGKALTVPFGIYGRKDSNVMLLTPPAKGPCTVLARISRADAAPAVVEAVSAQVKAQPKRDKDNNLIWLSGRTAIQLAATGDNAKPALRIAVIQLAEKPGR